MIIWGAYVIFAMLAMGLFLLRPARQAALIGYFGGWLILPVGIYDPHMITATGFTFDVVGTALPSDLLLTKALVIPLAVLAGLVATAPAVLRDFRPKAIDAIIAALCLTPFLAFAASRTGFGDALVQAAYLSALWGGTWLIGRVLLNGDEGAQGLAKAMAISGLCLVPAALLEGFGQLRLYGLVYGAHPFQADGLQRYIGARPVVFFEHGNQYGIWIAIAALAAYHLARQHASRSNIAIATLLIASAIASQSIGAIILLAIGAIILEVSARARHVIVIAGAALLLAGAGAYLAGKSPIERLAYHSSAGQTAMAMLKSVGRGSLTWRVHRDVEAVDTIARAPIAGYGRWDWWRPLNTHPWGLPLLLAGQFGLIALALAAFGLLAGPLRALWSGSSGGVLPVVVIISAIDGCLNSFIYVPAVLAAAAMGDPFRPGRRSLQNEEDHRSDRGADSADAR